MVAAITIGAGRRQPQGERVALDPRAPAESLGLALALHRGGDAWWSVSAYAGDYRTNARWEGATALAVDVDHATTHTAKRAAEHEGASPSEVEAIHMPRAVALRAGRALENAPGTWGHLTRAGLRIVAQLDRPIVDRVEYEHAWRAFAVRVASWLDREGLTPELAIDDVHDFARLLFVPHATIAGRRRLAVVRAARDGVVGVAELLAERSDDQAHDDDEREPIGDEGEIPAGKRDNALTSFAGKLRRVGLDEAEILGALRAKNRKCVPPKSDADVARIARSVAKYPPGDVSDEVPEPCTWSSFSDRARARATRGPAVHLPTGFATLDTASRGGLRAGHIVALVGPPSVGKSQIAARHAYDWARAGIPVVYVAVDSSAEDVDPRFATFAGFDRDKLEDDDAAEWSAAEAKLASLPLDVKDFASLADARARLDERAGSGVGVLVLDSLQKYARRTARARRGEHEERAGIDDVLQALRELRAERPRWLVVVTSETPRVAYANRDEARLRDPMAAGKGSGDVEYALDVQIVLASVEDGHGVLTDATVPKLRKGRGKLPLRFRLALDRDGGVREVPLPEDAPSKSAAERFEAVRVKVLDTVAAGEHRSANAVYRVVGGTKAETLEAVRELRAEGAVELVDGVLRAVGRSSP